MTYGLVDTIAGQYFRSCLHARKTERDALFIDCETMCLNVEGCVFVNSYHDVNGKVSLYSVGKNLNTNHLTGRIHPIDLLVVHSVSQRDRC